MAQMPDIGSGRGPVEGFAHRVEHDAADTMRDLMHPHGRRHQDLPQPAAAPSPTETQPHRTEDYMQLLDDFDALIGHVKDAAAKAETIDRDALAKIAQLKSTPEGSEAFELLAGFATAEGAGPVLAIAATTLRGFAALAPAQPAA